MSEAFLSYGKRCRGGMFVLLQHVIVFTATISSKLSVSSTKREKQIAKHTKTKLLAIVAAYCNFGAGIRLNVRLSAKTDKN